MKLKKLKLFQNEYASVEKEHINPVSNRNNLSVSQTGHDPTD